MKMENTSRRDFIRNGFAMVGAGMSVIAAADSAAASGAHEAAGDPAQGLDVTADSETRSASARKLKVRFLGTGAIDWERGPNEFGETRRFASVLVNGKALIDLTGRTREMLPEGCRPEAVFYTHSHRDHFDAEAALSLGVKRVYCHKSWAKTAVEKFEQAANGRPVPEVNGIVFGAPVPVCGTMFTALPANHSTKRKGEHCAIYLIDKGPARLLYATDTCGIPRDALKHAGLERNAGRPLTAIIMEATAGIGQEDNPRFFFSHSSVDLVARTVRALAATGRYRPPASRPVYITHLIRSQYASMAELENTLPAPLKAAYDGLEVEF